jgi:hypothetical protein
MNNINDDENNQYNKMSDRVDQRFLIKLSIRVNNKGIEFGVIIRALLIYCRLEPIPILK